MNDYRQHDYTIKEACQHLRISRPTLYSLLRDGTLRSYRLGERSVRITWESVTTARAKRDVPAPRPHAGEAA